MVDDRKRRRRAQRADMVCWYDPPQLLDTARRVIESSLIAESADPRHLQALETPDEAGEPFLEFRDREELVVDFTADLGDGFESSHAVACAMEQSKLPLAGGLGRAELVVLGGDQVYPTASDKAYRRRFALPFEEASEKIPGEARPTFVLPGNHDWYDSLVAFRGFFCGEGGQVGSLQFPQRRSYFAIALPHRVWLLGVDFQLAHDLDGPQLEHFQHIVATMREGDRILLCMPEPIWVHDFEALMATHPEDKDELDAFMREEHPRLHALLDSLEARGARPVAWLSGDLHHYRRHVNGSLQLVTSGGGGAFAHPTHAWRDHDHPYSVQPITYPTHTESFRLGFGNLFFLRRNWTFGLFTGFLYALVFLTMSATLHGTEHLTFANGAWTSFGASLDQPAAVLLVAFVYGGFYAFTDTRGALFRVFACFFHGSAHLGAALLMGLAAARYVSVGQPVIDTFVRGGLLALGGFFVGPCIMGLYLLTSLNVFRRHRNEAFSALRVGDYGHFLRLVFDRSGEITLHAIATPKNAEPKLIETVKLPR